MTAWFYRGCFVAVGVGLLVTAGACGDDDPVGAVDAGPDTNVQPPPPPFDGGSPPAEAVDTTGRLGPATVVADIGSPIDGPSWRVADQSLYFTVPNGAPSLRRLVTADGGVEGVAAYDGGPPGPYGTASNGGSTLFATEPTAVAVLAYDDAGIPTITRRASTFELLGDIAAEERPDASTLAFFVDTAKARAYRYDPAGGANELSRVLDLDAGRATAIAVSRDDVSRRVVHVAVGNGASGAVINVRNDDDGGAIVIDSITLPGTSPNGIAIDDQANVLVAWARGIDMYTEKGTRLGLSPGLPLAAAPTSLAFGGPDRKTLYVTTAAGKIYAIPTQVAGVLR